MMKLSPFPIVAALALVGALIGCQPAAEGAPDAGAKPASTGQKLKIVYIPKNTGNPYFNEVNKGFEDACKELGAEFTTTGPATADAASQIPIIKDQIQRGVDVIAISVNSPNALNPVLDQARSRGVVVVTVDSDLVGNESHRDAAVLPTDFSQVGQGQVELLAELMNYEGDFAILSATTDAPNQNAWIETMKETLKDPKYSKMKLVATVYGDDEPQKSTTECEALLTRYPNLKGIVSPTSVGLAAAAQVFEQRGVFPGGPNAKGGGVQLTGLSTPDQLRRFVKSGVLSRFQLWAPYNEGYIAAHLGHMIKSGKVKPEAGAEVEFPKLGKRTFSEKLELTGSPLTTFDKNNIDEYKF